MTRALTGENEWVEFFAGRELAEFDPTAPRRVVVLAAHPDDETLGVGGTVQALHAAGAEVGDAVHGVLLAREELDVLVEHVEDDFVLHVLRRR